MTFYDVLGAASQHCIVDDYLKMKLNMNGNILSFCRAYKDAICCWLYSVQGGFILCTTLFMSV